MDEINLNELFAEMDAEADVFLEKNPQWKLGDYHITINKDLTSSIEKITIELKDNEESTHIEQIGESISNLCIKQFIEEFSKYIQDLFEEYKNGDQDEINTNDFHLTMDLWILKVLKVCGKWVIQIENWR